MVSSITSELYAMGRLVLITSEVQALEDHLGSEDEDLTFQTGDIIAVFARRRHRYFPGWPDSWEKEWEWSEYTQPRGRHSRRDGWWLGSHLQVSKRVPGKVAFNPTYVEHISREKAHDAIRFQEIP